MGEDFNEGAFIREMLTNNRTWKDLTGDALYKLWRSGSKTSPYRDEVVEEFRLRLRYGGGSKGV